MSRSHAFIFSLTHTRYEQFSQVILVDDKVVFFKVFVVVFLLSVEEDALGPDLWEPWRSNLPGHPALIYTLLSCYSANDPSATYWLN